MNHKKIVIVCFLIFIIFLTIYSINKVNKHQLYNSIIASKNSIFNTKSNILISEQNNLQKINPTSYTYTLPQDQYIHLTLQSNVLHKISYFLFDDNKLKINAVDSKKQIAKLSSEYEITPGKNELFIVYKDGSRDKIQLDVKYLFNADDYNNSIDDNINQRWIPNDKRCFTYIPNKGMELGGNCKKDTIAIDYEKNFLNDVSLTIEFIPTQLNTVDLKLSFGERIFLNFDNNKIQIRRKESLNNSEKDKFLATPLYVPYKHFKKGIKYTLKLERSQNKYTLFINNHEEVTFLDDMKNPIPKEQYKNVRIAVGKKNMKILINRIEIK
jgi:hypothetical protein